MSNTSHKNTTHQNFKEVLLFLKQYLCKPKEVGSICPSLPALGKIMASFIESKNRDVIVELGPGTGSITKVLLKCGISPKNFHACELSPDFICHLSKRFPEINLIQGNAAELTQVLPELAGKTDCIISGLPLKILPPMIVEQIVDEVYKMLKLQGRVIQFTYDLRKPKTLLTKKFKHTGSKIVLGNIPPARVNVFTKE